MLYSSWYKEPEDNVYGTNTAFITPRQTTGLDIIFCVTPQSVFLNNSGSAADLNTICPWHAEPFYNFPSGPSPRLETRTGLRDFNFRSNPLETPIDPLLDKPFYIANATEQWTGTVYDIGRDRNNDTLTKVSIRDDSVPFEDLVSLEVPFRPSTFSLGVETEVFFDHNGSNLQLRFFLVFAPFGCTEDAHCITFAECDMDTYRCACPAGTAAVNGTGGYSSALECVDTAPPVVTLLGDDPVRLEAGTNTTFDDPGVDAQDRSPLEPVNVIGQAALDTALTDKQLGNYTLTYVVTDTADNEADPVSRTVIVEDTTPPEVTLLGDAVIDLQPGVTTSFDDPGAVAIDLVDGVIPAVLTPKNDADKIQTFLDNKSQDFGIDLIYGAVDSQGNVGTVQRRLRFLDTLPPVITMTGGSPLAVEANKDGAYVDPGVTLIDAAFRDEIKDTPPSYTTEGADAVNLAVPGNYTIVYRATDQEGNSATAERIVVVQDTTAPVVILEGNAEDTVEAATEYSDPGAAASDNLDTSITVVRDPVSIDTTQPDGTVILIIYTATDVAGNAASVTRTLTVTDTKPPDVTLFGDSSLTIESATTFTDLGASAIDALDGAVSVERDPVELNTAQQDSTVITLTYSATDAAGNRNQVTRTLTFEDTTPPDVTLVGAALVQVETTEPHVDAGATAADSLDGPLPVTVNPTNIDTAVADQTEYTITYTSIDAAGNVGTAERRVIVRDTIPPVFKGTDGEEYVTFNGAEAYTLSKNVMANDRLDGDVQVTISSGAVDRTKPGRYTLTLTASDAAGNAATGDYTVIVSPPRNVPDESTWYIKVTNGALLPSPVDHFELSESLASYVATGTLLVVLEAYRLAGVIAVAVFALHASQAPWVNATGSMTQFRRALKSRGDADMRRGLSQLWSGEYEYALVLEVEDSVFETPDSSSDTGAAAPAGAIAGGVVVVALLLLLIFAIYKHRQRRNALAHSPRQSHLNPAAATRAVMFQADNPTFAVAGNGVAAKQWIMSLGEPTATDSGSQEGVLPGAYAEAGGAQPSPYGAPMLLVGADATEKHESAYSYAKVTKAAGIYDTPEHAYEQPDTGAGYARPVRAGAQNREHRLSTVSVQPGYTALSEDHNRDADAYVPDERLRTGDALPQSRAAPGTAAGYALLDGTQQLYERDAGGVAGGDSGGNTSNTLTGLYATAESSSYSVLPRTGERRPTLFSLPTRQVLGVEADEEA
jgi:hypothetical protein